MENTSHAQPITTAVFLVGGKGVRMQPLTYTTPKPLLTLCGKTLIEHNLNELPSTVTDILFVISYLGEQFRTTFGSSFVVNGNSRNVHYVEQGEPKGTAHALSVCKDTLANLHAERFFVLMGDDLYTRTDLEALDAAGGTSLLAIEKIGTEEAPVWGGRLIIQESGENGDAQSLLRIDEGQHTGTVLLNAAAYTIPYSFFTYPLIPLDPYKPSGELGLPQTIVHQLATHPIHVVHATRWVHLTDIHDLKKAEVELMKISLPYIN